MSQVLASPPPEVVASVCLVNHNVLYVSSLVQPMCVSELQRTSTRKAPAMHQHANN